MTKRRRPSPSSVIACLALFFAVAGGSAIALQGRNTVDSGDIKPKAVKTSDIANNAVTTRKLKNNHVRTADIQNGQVRRADLAPDESFHRVGAAGEPQFGNGGENDCFWSEVSQPPPVGDPFMEPAFYMDHQGIVRLTGAVVQTDGLGGDGACDDTQDAFVFTLPPAYRPPELMVFSSGLTDSGVLVAGTQILLGPGVTLPAGTVAVSGGTPPASAVLDGVSFRAAGTGVGLPRRGGTTRISAEMVEMIGLGD